MNKSMLIILTANTAIENEADAINALFENGLNYLHLRKKTWFKNELIAFIENIASKWYKNIVLHTHPQLVFEYDLKGFHFNKSQPYNEQLAKKIKATGKTLSASSHSICDMSEFSLEVDYQLVSPIFSSNSKNNESEVMDHTKLKNYLVLKPKSKFIALSGIEPNNIIDALNLGFDGVAVLSYIWNDFEKDKKMDNLIDRFLSLQNALNKKAAI